MANVQPENGTVNIAHDLFEAIIKMKISRTHKDHVLAVIRKTYGYRDKKTKKPKKEDAISYSQFAILCDCTKRESMRCIKDLVSWNILSYDKSDICLSGHYINKYSLVKDFDLWDKKVWKQKTGVSPDICLNEHMTKTEKQVSGLSPTETNNTETNIVNTETNTNKKKKTKAEKLNELKVKMENDSDFRLFKSLYPTGWTDAQGQFNPYYCEDIEVYTLYDKLDSLDKQIIKEHLPVYLNTCRKIFSPINYLKRKAWIILPINTLLKISHKGEVIKNGTNKKNIERAYHELHGGDYSDVEKNTLTFNIDEPADAGDEEPIPDPI